MDLLFMGDLRFQRRYFCGHPTFVLQLHGITIGRHCAQFAEPLHLFGDERAQPLAFLLQHSYTTFSLKCELG